MKPTFLISFIACCLMAFSAGCIHPAMSEFFYFTYPSGNFPPKPGTKLRHVVRCDVISHRGKDDHELIVRVLDANAEKLLFMDRRSIHLTAPTRINIIWRSENRFTLILPEGQNY